KGSDDAGTSGGNSKCDFAVKIGEKVLQGHPAYAALPNKSPKQLGRLVKSCITWLITQFDLHFCTLKQTGHGLVMEGKANTLTGELKNAWDWIKVLFPWYRDIADMAMHSPSFNSTALDNSQSQVDVLLLTNTTHAVSAMPTRKVGKDMFSSVLASVAEKDRESRVEIAQIHSQAQVDISVKQEQTRQDHKLHKEELKINLEYQRLEFQREQMCYEASEAEKRREHEFKMLQAQIQVETLQRDNNAGPDYNIDPFLC
ncbi:hypothetical protein K488DRAFT_75249, partial [Vararia minispora EC-137]